MLTKLPSVPVARRMPWSTNVYKLYQLYQVQSCFLSFSLQCRYEQITLVLKRCPLHWSRKEAHTTSSISQVKWRSLRYREALAGSAPKGRRSHETDKLLIVALAMLILSRTGKGQILGSTQVLSASSFTSLGPHCNLRIFCLIPARAFWSAPQNNNMFSFLLSIPYRLLKKKNFPAGLPSTHQLKKCFPAEAPTHTVKWENTTWIARHWW